VFRAPVARTLDGQIEIGAEHRAVIELRHTSPINVDRHFTVEFVKLSAQMTHLKPNSVVEPRQAVPTTWQRLKDATTPNRLAHNVRCARRSRRNASVTLAVLFLVLLQNRENGAGRMLPLRKGTRVYAIGDVRKATIEAYGFTVTDGNHTANQPRATAAGYDYAIISITALNPPAVTATYKSVDPATGANPLLINPITRKVFGADDPSGLDDGLIFWWRASLGG
jgi:hypothetical protein